MSRIGLKAKDEKMFRLLKETIESTNIIKRQFELAFGRWDFIVYGPKDAKTTIIRKGFAKHICLNHSFLYTASLKPPDHIYNTVPNSVPLEEFINGDIPAELKGLEIFHIEPLRTISITETKEGTSLEKTKDSLLREYEGQNMAIIETPNESFWGLSILKYLNECDEYFPDVLKESLANGTLPFNTKSNNFFDIDPTRGWGDISLN